MYPDGKGGLEDCAGACILCDNVSLNETGSPPCKGLDLLPATCSNFSVLLYSQSQAIRPLLTGCSMTKDTHSVPLPVHWALSPP